MIRHLTLTLFAFLALAAPAAAKAPIIGIGDQHADMFHDRSFQRLGVKHSRLLVAWDWHKSGWMTQSTTDWMNAARATGVRPLVAFGRNWGDKRGHKRLPSLRAYRKSFRLFRERFPWVRDYSAWNEANHPSQPTWNKPKAAARYYNAMRRDCRKCTVVAADLLDSPTMLKWVKKFKKHARKPRIWGLHNYKHANDGKPTTKVLLKAVRGQVWLTETGGMLRLKPHSGSSGKGRKHTKRHQAKSVMKVFKIARKNRRVKRVYFYEWKKRRGNRWDSAFLDANGRPRPAYRVLKRGLRR